MVFCEIECKFSEQGRCQKESIVLCGAGSVINSKGFLRQVSTCLNFEEKKEKADHKASEYKSLI